MFTDSLVFLGLLVLVCDRAYPILVKKQVELKYPKQWKGLYSLVIVNIFLTTCLYMLSSANFSFKRVGKATENLTIISFYLLPQILMVLCYVLLY